MDPETINMNAETTEMVAEPPEMYEEAITSPSAKAIRFMRWYKYIMNKYCKTKLGAVLHKNSRLYFLGQRVKGRRFIKSYFRHGLGEIVHHGRIVDVQVIGEEDFSMLNNDSDDLNILEIDDDMLDELIAQAEAENQEDDEVAYPMVYVQGKCILTLESEIECHIKIAYQEIKPDQFIIMDIIYLRAKNSKAKRKLNF